MMPVKEKRRDEGFSLLELMIVIEIMAIIGAVTVPSLLRHRITANETSAVYSLRRLCTAQISFNASNHRYGTFEELTAGAGVGAGAYLDGAWHEGVTKNEYVFNLVEVTQTTFLAVARPASPGRTGVRTFKVDQAGDVLWMDEGDG